MANLLERASVVLTPTAYNNGEALCIKPDDASGDFQFSRNSAATRVNAQGLVENVQILSSNLVQNGDFSEEGAEEVSNGSFTNGSTDGNGGTGWSIGEDKAVADGTTNNAISQTTISSVVGKSYKIDFTIDDYVTGNIRIYFGGVFTPFVNSNGVYSFYIAATAVDALATSASGLFNGSITNISVKEVGQNWDIVSANASIGENKLIANSVVTENIATQSGVVPISKPIILKFDLILNSGGFRVLAGSGGTATNITTSGTYTLYETSGTGGTLTLQSRFGSFEGSVTNLSIIEITTDTNLPRINYEGFSYDGSGNVVPNSGCGSWLWENQSTNLITYSNDYSQWNKGASTTISPNYAISPDGTQNATRFQTPTGGGTYLSLAASMTIGSIYTLSLYLKNNGGENLDIGVATSSSVGAKTASIEVNLTSEWVRYELSFTADSNSNFVFIDNINNANAIDCLVWGAQLEQQSYATSYIPTNGEANGVTRNQDVCTNGGSLATINSTEGVLYAELEALANDLTNRVISLSDGSTANRVSIVLGTISNQIRGQVLSSGTSFDFSTTSYNTLNNNKIAISYKLNDFSMWINGTKVSTDTSGNTPVGMNTISFNAGGGTLPFFGKTKALAVWKEALSDEELQSLTTI